MSFDEFLFKKLSLFLQRQKQKKRIRAGSVVRLESVKPRLTLIADAVTGESIHIFPALREGGYKNNNFFLPEAIYFYENQSDNIDFYVFRTLYLSIQKRLGINWETNESQSLAASRKAAMTSSETVLKVLFEEFPGMLSVYRKIKEHFIARKPKDQEPDFSYIYGKWMYSTAEEEPDVKLSRFDRKLKNAIQEEITTVLQAKAVEEMQHITVDKKQQEEAVIHNYFEKIETLEEFGGSTWRDFDGDDEMDEHQDAMEELNMSQTVRVDDPAHSLYHAEFRENVNVAESAEKTDTQYHIRYDEWNYSKREYKYDYCKLFPKKITETDVAFYKKTIRNHASTLMGLRKMLTSVNNKSKEFRRQIQGENFDIDALTDLFMDIKTGHTPSDKVYISKRKKEKDLSILMLLDTSLSSDSYANNNHVISVEKEVSILFGEILNEFQVDFSINSFNSKTRNYSNYYSIKAFDEPWEKAKYKVGSIKPAGYTRIGVALRHSGNLLAQRESKNKWIILISDGKPNDYDRYEGKYGVNDVKQALRELNVQHINSYALAIEARARYYLPQMFGTNHYEILTSPIELLQSLTKLYEKIKFKS